jgi:hypothetical protein
VSYRRTVRKRPISCKLQLMWVIQVCMMLVREFRVDVVMPRAHRARAHDNIEVIYALSADQLRNYRSHHAYIFDDLFRIYLSTHIIGKLVFTTVSCCASGTAIVERIVRRVLQHSLLPSWSTSISRVYIDI